MAVFVNFLFPCALMSGSVVKCWGHNLDGELGNGAITQFEPPVDVVGAADGFLEITVGGGFTCALTTAGGVKCWGSDNFGFMGSVPTTFTRTQPVDVVGLSGGIAGVEAGWDYVCTLSIDGTVKCGGSNSDGQLGDGTALDRPVPGVVISL